jgi:hypothetical protein
LVAKWGSTEIHTLASLLTLSFAYKLVDCFVFVDSVWHTHTICFFSFFLFFFFDWKYLFSLALGPLQNLLELGICTHSHDAGSSVRCFATLGKPLSKDKVTKGKDTVKEEESAKEKEICVYQSWPALAGGRL